MEITTWEHLQKLLYVNHNHNLLCQRQIQVKENKALCKHGPGTPPSSLGILNAQIEKLFRGQINSLD